MASWIDIEPLLIRSVRGAMERATFSRDLQRYCHWQARLAGTAIGRTRLANDRELGMRGL
ncbi:hypothetical protein JJD41_00815 [Oxynema sp. CENA135]|uniref:hypothetical protein n=1 Tax=Oxynema sp. CENA135 TaxID=984206 RepID=UPI00190AD044|nr:hypothetical protein [Oxynema sp. CENA135]MBK4728434.1 hypothetical protein [Oxynema sp. CENA135]